MIRAVTRWMRSPWAMTAGATGLLLAGLLVGVEPVGGDPDRLYRPLKVELARFLAAGRLPFWSDRLGLGLPLLAESHVAALYPPNWLLYGALDVSTAYRLAMWSHYIFMALGVYAYSRFLGASQPGSAVAGVAFTFCGFQAIHSSHEPFYQILPYLPLALLFAEWHLASGRLAGLVLVACAWGLQLTLGHFQLQAWTAGLVVAIGLWRTVADPRLWRRFLGLVLALCWGAALAAVQLNGSWELNRFLGFTHRSFAELANYSFPPAHWAELAIPCFLRGLPGGPEGPYWLSQGSTGYEACLYVGTVPLFLAILAFGGGRDRAHRPWLALGALAVVLAMLPRLWPSVFAAVLQLPGFGWFRAPGRYTLVASLGLCLAAGRGVDRLLSSTVREYRLGVVLAWTSAVSAGCWAYYWASGPGFRSLLGGARLYLALGLAGVSWLFASGLIAACRRRWIGPSWLVLAAAVELGALYYTSTTVWGVAVRLPRQSPILTRLAQERNAGRVAGVVSNLPLWDGMAPFSPYTGFGPLPPHSDFEFVKNRQAALTSASMALLHRYGASHGVWDGPVDPRRAEILLETRDPALDELVIKSPGSGAHPLWRLVRYPPPFPEIRAADRVRLAADEAGLLRGIVNHPDPRTVWFLADDEPSLAPDADTDAGPRATSARVTSWDGTTAVVDHDGTCDLVINRTYYPGWFATVNGGPERPVARAEAGIQAVRLFGGGVSRVRLSYSPTRLRAATVVSLGALSLAALALLGEGIREIRARKARSFLPQDHSDRFHPGKRPENP